MAHFSSEALRDREDLARLRAILEDGARARETPRPQPTLRDRFGIDPETSGPAGFDTSPKDPRRRAPAEA